MCIRNGCTKPTFQIPSACCRKLFSPLPHGIINQTHTHAAHHFQLQSTVGRTAIAARDLWSGSTTSPQLRNTPTQNFTARQLPRIGWNLLRSVPRAFLTLPLGYPNGFCQFRAWFIAGNTPLRFRPSHPFEWVCSWGHGRVQHWSAYLHFLLRYPLASTRYLGLDSLAERIDRK